MVHVIATVTVKSGKREVLLKALRANVPNVLAEDGCVRYEPTVDTPSGFPNQGALRDDVVVILETWASLEHLKAHLATPHMASYREQVKDLVAAPTALQVLASA